MANIIRQLAYARENSHFKVEQEADLQRHAKRLARSGQIKEIAGAYLRPRRELTLEESMQTYEVLAEILQQGARIDDPDAAARQEYVRRVRSELPKLTDAEMAHYRSSLYGVAAVGHVPKISLGRNRYGALHAAASANAPPPRALSPQAREAARRVYTAGVRSLLYGSAVGVAGCLLLAAVAARALDVSAPEELRERLTFAAEPIAGRLQAALLPVKARIQVFFDGFGGDTAGSGASDSQFSRALGERLQTRYGRNRALPGASGGSSRDGAGGAGEGFPG
ncbi:hypothetical protein WJX81_005026 [Elliptochloris bilobata]|uniref:Uncharacterized protein n=1 Tax=Elliptochloris bilobata TaxID=381761 RepID=A0AAW1QD89_9CHLO